MERNAQMSDIGRRFYRRLYARLPQLSYRLGFAILFNLISSSILAEIFFVLRKPRLFCGDQSENASDCKRLVAR
jgi:hypothetical protein